MRQMLEFCARHQILAQAEIFPMAEVNRAVAKVRKNDVRYRAVLVR
jgi:D-arabinose 1-dehydrogenase-like Zn-dependent alcohol dehydrogenase